MVHDKTVTSIERKSNNGQPSTEQASDPRLNLLKQYGSRPIQYSTLQKGLTYCFLGEDGEIEILPAQCDNSGPAVSRGYLAFERVGSLLPDQIVLGDPVASGEDAETLLDRFLAKYPRTCFWQLSRSTALLLSRRGFYINECGIETSISIGQYDLKGSDKQNLRTARNKATRKKIVVVEKQAESIDYDELRRVSSEWLARKPTSGTELRFLARPAVLHRGEPHVRKFFAYEEGQLVGFTFFNPLFRCGKIIGYTADIQRTSDDSSKGLSYVMVLKAMEQFGREPHVEMLSLGWSPLYNIQDSEYFNSPLTTLLLVAQFQMANRLYSYKGLAKNKAEYRGHEEPVYFASRHRLPLRQIYRSYRACNISPLVQTIRAVWKAVSDD